MESGTDIHVSYNLSACDPTINLGVSSTPGADDFCGIGPII